MRRLVLFCLFILLLAIVPAVSAHAILLSAEPKPNALLNNAPPRVRILFSEPVVPAFSNITVLAASGEVVSNADLKADNTDSTALAVTLPALPNGTYLVTWEALSAVDGHGTRGSFPFGVGVGQLTGSANANTAPVYNLTDISARWLTLTGLALLIGLFAFRWLVWQPSLEATELDEAFGQGSLKIGGGGLVLLGLGLVLTVIPAWEQYKLNDPANLTVWLATRYGTMWLTRVGLLIVLANLVFILRHERRDWGWWVGAALTLGLIGATSLVSHSAALRFNATPTLLVDAAHILTAGIWAGGLAYLGWALYVARGLPTADRATLTLNLLLNFSTSAAGAVGLLIVSGGYLAAEHIGQWTALFGTAYGRALLIKIALALPAFGIAGFNLLILKPRLQAYSAQWGQRFIWLVRAETLFAFLVLVGAGLLTDLQRAREAPLLTDQAGRLELTQTADDLNVTLALDPALVGQSAFEVTLTANGQPVSEAKEVSLRFTSLAQSLGTSTAIALPDGDGRYRVEGGYLSLVGPWQIEVVVRREGTFDAFAAFRVEAGLNGVIRPIENNTNYLDSLVGFLNRGGGLVTGAALCVMALGWSFFAGQAGQRPWQYGILLLPTFFMFWAGGTQLINFFRDFTPARFAVNPILPDAASIARGGELYGANCITCHGEIGRGDGPASASLKPPPADFTAGHTETHPDGDLYWWIKTGVPNSAMPAFGEQFTEDDLWHLVNYVRRLSVRTEETTLPPAPTPAPTPTPLGGPLPSVGQSDLAALDVLEAADRAMGELTSMREEQVLFGDAGTAVTYTIASTAPDREHIRTSSGNETLRIGQVLYSLDRVTQLWIPATLPNAFVFPPDGHYALYAVGARLEGEATLNGVPVVIVAYADSDALARTGETVAYRLWVEQESKRVVQMVMEAPGHHMRSRLYDFNVPLNIEPPAPQNIGPTPTAVGGP